MATDKKRDIAKDFADFLSSEAGGKTKTAPLVVAPSAAVANTSLKNIPQFSSPPVASADSMVAQNTFHEAAQLVGNSQTIKAAQQRILDLEKERDGLREEIEKLLVTSENLEAALHQSKAMCDQIEKKQKEKIEILEEEKLVIHERFRAREQELIELRKKNEDLDLRFQAELKKVRVKEKELENKNVILKAEAAAVTRSKDEMILDLKRQIDNLQYEIENYKIQFSSAESTMREWRERQTRTVKALRLALSIMEGADDEVTQGGFKKVAGNE